MKSPETLHSGWRIRVKKWTGRILAQKWFDVGLHGKMSALVTIGLTGLIGIFSFLAISTARQMTQQLLDEHVLRVHILAENMDSSISHVAGMLTILSAHIDMADPQASLNEWGTIFEQDFRPVRAIYVLDADNQLRGATNTVTDIDWDQVIPQQGLERTPARIISAEGLPSPYAIVAVPILNPTDDLPTGTIAALLDLSDPDMLMSGGFLKLDVQEPVLVLDAQGRVLVNTQPELTLTASTLEKVTSQFASTDQPKFEACLGCSTNDVDTGAVIVMASLSQVPWGVLIWHESPDLFAPVRTIGIQTLILGMLAIVGALILVMLTTRSVIEPVQTLTIAAQKIGEGQFAPATMRSIECDLATTLARKAIHGRDEIGVLANSFIMMCRRLQQSMDEIQTWNRELDARVQARTKQLSILNAVALTVNQSLNLDDILNRALDEVMQLTEIDVIAIFIQNTAGGRLELQAYRGLTEEAARLANQVGLLDSSCGGVTELGRTVIVPDISYYRGRGARSLQRENIASIMHVPLINKGWTLGSMCVGTHDATQFNPEEQELLTSIGNQIAIAIENARLYADVQRKERVRGELFSKTLAAQEDERRRIARELHDEVSQSLAALLYEAEGGLELEKLTSIKKRLQSICDLSRHTLDNVHNLMFDLRPSMLDQLGLIPALRWLSQSRLEPKGIRVNVTANSGSSSSASDDHSHRLESEIETALYRVVQEAINNIARHSAARNVEISLVLEDGTASVCIADDGIGFDYEELNLGGCGGLGLGAASARSLSAADTRGLGLLGMQERIQLLGGEMEIITAPGNGTRISIRVPLEVRRPAYA